MTDHRINFTVHALNDVLDGDLDAIVGQLQAARRTERGP
jgi:protein subunit release factor A